MGRTFPILDRTGNQLCKGNQFLRVGNESKPEKKKNNVWKRKVILRKIVNR